MADLITASTCPWHDPALQDRLSAATRKAQYSSGSAVTHDGYAVHIDYGVYEEKLAHDPALDKDIGTVAICSSLQLHAQVRKMDTEILRAICRTAAATSPSREDQSPT